MKLVKKVDLDYSNDDSTEIEQLTIGYSTHVCTNCKNIIYISIKSKRNMVICEVCGEIVYL